MNFMQTISSKPSIEELIRLKVSFYANDHLHLFFIYAKRLRSEYHISAKRFSSEYHIRNWIRNVNILKTIDAIYAYLGKVSLVLYSIN